jgi:hypothetical protein
MARFQDLRFKISKGRFLHVGRNDPSTSFRAGMGAIRSNHLVDITMVLEVYEKRAKFELSFY